MAIRPPQAVLVDLDGVIADTFEIHVRGWLRVMEEVGGKPDPALCSDLRGVPTLVAIETVCERLGVAPSASDLNRLSSLKTTIRDDAIRQLTPEAVLPGAATFLRRCRAGGIPLICLATTSAAPEILRRLGIRDLLDEVICGSSVEMPKASSASAAIAALQRLKVEPRKALLLDDGPNVVWHALDAGIPALLVSGSVDDRSADGRNLPAVAGLTDAAPRVLWQLATDSFKPAV